MDFVQRINVCLGTHSRRCTAIPDKPGDDGQTSLLHAFLKVVLQRPGTIWKPGEERIDSPEVLVLVAVE